MRDKLKVEEMAGLLNGCKTECQLPSMMFDLKTSGWPRLCAYWLPLQSDHLRSFGHWEIVECEQLRVPYVHNWLGSHLEPGDKIGNGIVHTPQKPVMMVRSDSEARSRPRRHRPES